jgi:hypothetical protein
VAEGNETEDPDKERPQEDQEGGSEDPGELPPPPDPERLDEIEFAVKRLWTEAPLVVTVAEGPVGSDFAPAELIGKLAERIASLIQEVAGSQTMLYGVAPGNSMTMFFGDPTPGGPQEQLAYEATLDAAERVADLVGSDDDEFLAKAIGVGTPMRRYDELTQLVQGEGVTLRWQPRKKPARVLTPDRAGRQHVRLHTPPEMVEWDETVNGILYRIIAEPGAEEGSAGVHLFKWSTRPKGLRGGKLIAPADAQQLRNAIDQGLFGAAVQATLRIRRPRPGTAIDPDQIERKWISIEPGPGETSGLGMSIQDLVDEDES